MGQPELDASSAVGFVYADPPLAGDGDESERRRRSLRGGEARDGGAGGGDEANARAPPRDAVAAGLVRVRPDEPREVLGAAGDGGGTSDARGRGGGTIGVGFGFGFGFVGEEVLPRPRDVVVGGGGGGGGGGFGAVSASEEVREDDAASLVARGDGAARGRVADRVAAAAQDAQSRRGGDERSEALRRDAGTPRDVRGDDASKRAARGEPRDPGVRDARAAGRDVQRRRGLVHEGAQGGVVQAPAPARDRDERGAHVGRKREERLPGERDELVHARREEVRDEPLQGLDGARHRAPRARSRGRRRRALSTRRPH